MVSCCRELPDGLPPTRTCIISDPGCAGAEPPPAAPLPVPHPRQFVSAAQRQNAAAYAAAAAAATAALGRGPVPLAPSSTGWRVSGTSSGPGALARPVQARSAPACEEVSFAGMMLLSAAGCSCTRPAVCAWQGPCAACLQELPDFAFRLRSARLVSACDEAARGPAARQRHEGVHLRRRPVAPRPRRCWGRRAPGAAWAACGATLRRRPP